jgi:chemotaxis protein CheC
MKLTPEQQDALTELINIAFSRTAAALSDLTGRRVVLDKPSVQLYRLSELTSALGGFIKEEVASVHQVFRGPVAGDALLLLNYEGAVALTNLLTDPDSKSNRLNTSDQEVLIEVGNILLNACLGTFGNLLEVHISFAVPRLHLEALTALLDTLTINQEGLRYALVVFTNFHLRDSKVGGYLIIVLGVQSLDRLMQAVEDWARPQAAAR